MNSTETTRSRLLRAAMTRFASQGFDRTSVRDICDLARSNLGAVSYHFGGKGQLRRAVVRQAVETLAARYRRELDPHTHRAVALGRTADHHPDEVRVVFRELAGGGTLLAEALAPLARDLLGWARDLPDPGSLGAPSRSARTDTLHGVACALLASAWPFLTRHFAVSAEDRDRVLQSVWEGPPQT